MIKLYSTNCPKCNVLKQKLDMSGIEYELIHDMQPIIDRGFMEAPILEIDEETFLTFKEANTWVNEQQ